LVNHEFVLLMFLTFDLKNEPYRAAVIDQQKSIENKHVWFLSVILSFDNYCCIVEVKGQISSCQPVNLLHAVTSINRGLKYLKY
jgi:hypothetical protein